MAQGPWWTRFKIICVLFQNIGNARKQNIKDRGKDSSENASKANEDNHISKVKLLRYRQYTAEEIKRFNSNYC